MSKDDLTEAPVFQLNQMEPWELDEAGCEEFAREMEARGVTSRGSDNHGVTYEVAMEAARRMVQGPMDATKDVDDNFSRRR